MCGKHFYNVVKLRAIKNAWHVAIAEDAAATITIYIYINRNWGLAIRTVCWPGKLTVKRQR